MRWEAWFLMFLAAATVAIYSIGAWMQARAMIGLVKGCTSTIPDEDRRP